MASLDFDAMDAERSDSYPLAARDEESVSCKGRGICPSCGARRMVKRAAALVDDVLPHRFHEMIWEADETVVRLIHDHFVDVWYIAAQGPRHMKIAERLG